MNGRTARVNRRWLGSIRARVVSVTALLVVIPALIHGMIDVYKEFLKISTIYVKVSLCKGLMMLKFAFFVMSLMIVGCSATVTHQMATDGTGTGIRYYDSAPFLIIYSDGMGGLKWQIRYLPDQTRIMTATPTVIGGHTEMTLYFQNGMLGSVSTLGDTTEVPKALIGAVQTALPFLIGVAEGPKPPGFPAPYIYKLIVNNDKITFIGKQGNTRIEVPLNTGGQP